MTEEARAGSQPQNPANTRPASVDSTEVNSPNRQSGYGEEFLAQLKRRRDAALRLPPLPHSGRRDPAKRDDICGWWP